MSRGGWRWGAGRPAHHAKTNAVPRIDVRRLQRDGHFSARKSITMRWVSGASAVITIMPDVVRLSYRYHFADGWRQVQETVHLTQTDCHFGGSRRWFVCPRCGRLMATLYLRGWPACRDCAQLVYQSQSDDVIEQSWQRTYRIMHRLGQADDGPHAAPRRPNGMRRVTFERLLQSWLREEKLREDMIEAYMERYRDLL